jgi:hypothetical protein
MLYGCLRCCRLKDDDLFFTFYNCFINIQGTEQMYVLQRLMGSQNEMRHLKKTSSLFVFGR